MTVWSHLWSRLSLWRIMRIISLGLAIVVIITTIVFAHDSLAAPYTDKTITFTARLRSSSGGVVPDGKYNLRFSIYDQEAEGTALWSETYNDTNGETEGQDFRVQVTNGYLNVKLGSQVPFGTAINWGDALWLTMTVGATNQTTPDWDNEMSPRIQLTATPYSLNSGAVGGKTADELTQLGQGKQTDDSDNSSIFIDKTGSGNLIQLQAGSDDVFTIGNQGDITLGGNSDKTIAMGEASEGVGHGLTISAGSGEDGGDLALQGGNATDVDGTAGSVHIDTGTGANGSITLGQDNATTIVLGNNNSTTTVQGELYTSNIDSAEVGELIIGGGNATSINLGQDTSIDGSVAVTTDDSSALQIQNTSGDSVLNVDTENSQITLGEVDDIATLLVLDTKTGADDPLTGTNGAMYYNQSLSKFRCHEGGSWRDCITPLPVSVLTGADIVTDTTVPIDVEDMTFDLAANTKYYYKFMIIHDSPANTTGIGFGITAPDNLVMSNWCVNTTALTTVTNDPSLGAYCGVGDADIIAGANSNSFTSTMEGYIQTGDQPGNLKLRVKSGTAEEEVTIKEKSFGILQIIQ